MLKLDASQGTDRRFTKMIFGWFAYDSFRQATVNVNEHPLYTSDLCGNRFTFPLRKIKAPSLELSPQTEVRIGHGGLQQQQQQQQQQLQLRDWFCFHLCPEDSYAHQIRSGSDSDAIRTILELKVSEAQKVVFCN